MNSEEIQMIVDNEREWRVYMLKKVDNLEEELGTFKLRVFVLATVFGSASGLSSQYILKLMGM